MSRVDCSNVELGGAFPQQSFIVCTMPGILTLKLEMEMKWNWSWATQNNNSHSKFENLWQFFSKYSSEVSLIMPSIQNDFKDWIHSKKSADLLYMQFFWCQWEIQFIRRIRPDWKLSKESYERIFVKRGILSSVK